MMSALDGARSANAFQHQFRAVLSRAKELKAHAEKGEKIEPAAPKARAKTGGPAKRSKCSLRNSESRGTY